MRAEVEGSRLTGDELIHLLILLLVAGNETTRDLIGNTVLALLEHPEQLALLRSDPSLAPNAIEEVLRYSAPAQYMSRRAKAATVVGDARIEPGEEAVLWFGSANRDEHVFPDADAFDIRRANANRHLTFGIGTHFCLGAPLARLEGAIAIEALLSRFSGIRRADDAALPRMPSLQHRGRAFAPAPRRGRRRSKTSLRPTVMKRIATKRRRPGSSWTNQATTTRASGGGDPSEGDEATA